MAGEKTGRLGAIIGAALLLAAIAAGALLLLTRPGPGPSRISQDVPAAARLSRRGAPPLHRAPAERTAVARSTHDRAAKATVALGDELRRNRRAIADIDGMIQESDSAADKLRSQVARQDDTIAAQRQALATDSATDTERGDGEAALSAAVQMNDVARTSLTRYETTRSALLDRKTSLEQRNAVIAGRLKR